MKIKPTFLVAIILAFQIMLCSEHHAVLDKLMNSPKKQLFKVYHQLFNKEYDLNTEEGLHRYKVFKENLKWIKEENQKGHEYELGINQFSDLTHEEYKKNTLISDIEKSDKTFLGGENFKSDKIYAAGDVIVDYTEHFGEIKDQGNCSAGYPFASIGAIEANYSKKFGIKLKFSEQHIIDCLQTTGPLGGSAYDVYSVYDYFLKENGLFREADYPFVPCNREISTTCQQTATSAVYKIVNGRELCLNCGMSNWRAFMAKGPLHVRMDASSKEMQFFKNGIINLENCKWSPNHSIIAVGLQLDDKGEYLILRNSWGKSWGLNGYFKVRVNDNNNNTCLITQGAALPKLVQVNDPGVNPAPKPPLPEPVPECPTIFKDCNFLGDSLPICSSIRELNGIGWENFAKGFKIGKAMKVEFFKYKNCENCFDDFTLKGNEKCFDNFEDSWMRKYIAETTSVAVSMDAPPAGCIWLFEEPCYLGRKLEICNSIRNLNEFGMKDKVKSWKIGNNVEATFFLLQGWLGDGWGYKKDRAGGSCCYPYENMGSIRIYKK
jgi:xylem cysteine proteinase